MKILIANLGSTSFKFRLFDMQTEVQLARGGIDRIGQPESACEIEIGAWREQFVAQIPDHGMAVARCLESLTDQEHGCLQSVEDVAGIGLKTVFAGKLSGVHLVDERLLTEMESLAKVAPAHNPPYVAAMRNLQSAFPQLPLVAALETAFHGTIAPAQRAYAVPKSWQEDLGVQRWGFHGASHRYISERAAELLQLSRSRIISCHLGGSSSVCAIENGESRGTSMGMSPQSGLPQNNRVGDFDVFALPYLMEKTGKSLDELLNELSSQSGLLGLSGLSGDLRDLEQAASKNHSGAQLALDHYVSTIRHYLGAYFVLLSGADCIVFTGGIGENSQVIRSQVCRGMDWAGVELDETRNKTASGEARLSTESSRVAVWTIPTNEELVVARQTVECLQAS